MMLKKQYIEFYDKLTKREVEVVIYLLGNHSYKEIAESLFIHPSTVRRHSINVYQKAGVDNRKELKLKYVDLLEDLQLNGKYPLLEYKINKAISLSWKDEGEYKTYYNEFISVIEAMYNRDFSKRLHTTDNKNSFIDFLSNSINMVNDELQNHFLDKEMILKLMDSFKIKNRIVLFSNEHDTITHAYSNSTKFNINCEQLIGLKIENILNFDWKKGLSKQNYFQCTDVLDKFIFANLPNREAGFYVEKCNNCILISITLYPENRIDNQIPRVIELLEHLKFHLNSSVSTKSIIGNTISLEVESIYSELYDYITSLETRHGEN